jgi:hypothetical protein
VSPSRFITLSAALLWLAGPQTSLPRFTCFSSTNYYWSIRASVVCFCMFIS